MNKKPTLPNFLIAGMAKCGTSSLASYLKQHPDIFIPDRKEPRFLTSQDKEIYPLNGPLDNEVMAWYHQDYDQYVKLFEDADTKAIGEASADTLYFHQYSIPHIKKHLGDPKIIIILRNPVKRAFSAYTHLIRDGREKLSFEEGLSEESKRIEDNWELIYHYRSVSKYYEPIRNFKEQFSNILILTNDELLSNTQKLVNEVFNFLEVDASFHVDSSLKLNASGMPKSRKFYNFLLNESILKKMVRPFLRLFYKDELSRRKLLQKLVKKNLQKIEIDSHTEDLLKKEFKEDLKRTSDLIGKDLTFWVN